MKPSNGSRYLKAAAFLIVSGALYACGGGGTSIAGSGELTQGQFNALLATSTAFTDLQTKLAKDEATISSQAATITRMAQFGHAPGASVVAGRSVQSFNPHTGIAAQSISFGPCPDMGQHVGDSAPDPSQAAFEYFKECPINGDQYRYGASNKTGAIKAADKIWFTSSNCAPGTEVEIDDGEMYSSAWLRQGVVFRSPVDNSMMVVLAGQTGTSGTAHSDQSGAGCITEDTTAPLYDVTANDINVTGVPNSVPSDFID